MSVQDEYEATGQQYIMYRPYLHALRQAVQERQLRQLLLDGMPGAGKSIAVAALAHWARQAGWVVRTGPSLGDVVSMRPRAMDLIGAVLAHQWPAGGLLCME